MGAPNALLPWRSTVSPDCVNRKQLIRGIMRIMTPGVVFGKVRGRKRLEKVLEVEERRRRDFGEQGRGVECIEAEAVKLLAALTAGGGRDRNFGEES